MDIDQILDDCKEILKEHYGSRFQGLFLYGSIARGQKEQGSDMDLFVLLSRPFDYFHELRTIVDLLYPVQLKADWLISAKPVARDEFESGTINLYRVAKREGKATQYMKTVSQKVSLNIYSQACLREQGPDQAQVPGRMGPGSERTLWTYSFRFQSDALFLSISRPICLQLDECPFTNGKHEAR